MRKFLLATVAVLCPSGARAHELSQTALRELTRFEQFTATMKDFLFLGFEHILLGTDHILFLTALFLLPMTLWRALRLTTAFSFAHTLTFFLAIFGLVSVPPVFVEPFIAFSIAMVARSYFKVGSTHEREWVVCLLGLVHGLGFSGALRSIDFPPEVFAAAVVAFNLGVEVGQVILAALLLSFTRTFHRFSWYSKFLKTTGAALGMIGVVWGSYRMVFT